jgi:hypothetical protein
VIAQEAAQRRRVHGLADDVRREVAQERANNAGDYLYPKREYEQRKNELPKDATLVLY